MSGCGGGALAKRSSVGAKCSASPWSLSEETTKCEVCASHHSARAAGLARTASIAATTPSSRAVSRFHAIPVTVRPLRCSSPAHHSGRGRAFKYLCLNEAVGIDVDREARSEEHTSELQSLMRISYAVFCL